MNKPLQSLKKLVVLAIATLAISLNISAQEWYIYGIYTWSAPHPVGDFYEHHHQGEAVNIGGLEYQTIYVETGFDFEVEHQIIVDFDRSRAKAEINHNEL